MIGRLKEKDILFQALNSKRSEFVVVYGRRRIGKTYLIKEFFNNTFSFYTTGSSGLKTRDQLKGFYESLNEYGCKEKTVPTSWFDAFSSLKSVLQSEKVIKDAYSGKRIVFIDELPWFDTPRLDFKAALDFFWNSWASQEKDIVFIVCGSASSWIIRNLLKSTGGFYNRVTRIIRLEPFSLDEVKSLCYINNFEYTNQNILNLYMIFGGIPFYYNCLDNRLSVHQNINTLIIQESGQLHYEYQHLYHSIFKKAELHLSIIEALSNCNTGLTRTDLIKKYGLPDGKQLSLALEELSECEFIRKYVNYSTEKNNDFYQLIDPFTLFYIHFVENQKIASWIDYLNTPSFYSWQGNSFEIVCLLHIKKIKEILGISGIESREYSWRDNSKGGMQIDLIIDRKDGVINIVEIKCTSEKFEIDYKYEQILRERINKFYEITKGEKTILPVLISFNGLKINEYSDIIRNVITGNDLFT